jgi:hypothetical protein
MNKTNRKRVSCVAINIPVIALGDNLSIYSIPVAAKYPMKMTVLIKTKSMIKPIDFTTGLMYCLMLNILSIL